MAVTGVGRPWMRSKLPGTNDQEWRIASGNAYGGNALSGGAPPVLDMNNKYHHYQQLAGAL
ncbi:hypothetical protein LCGC14_2089030 [marine sediment metagenome]|uniref:Uncharacterized protein n=1 Tax=marine sediment metagenome TaxID=412755 RepID=A0A0F9F0N5_9ZZZZ